MLLDYQGILPFVVVDGLWEIKSVVKGSVTTSTEESNTPFINVRGFFPMSSTWIKPSVSWTALHAKTNFTVVTWDVLVMSKRHIGADLPAC